MSATTDVILAAGPTVVALAAVGSTVWQQKRGFSHDREMADLADTRRLFDEAAVALHAASVALSGLERALFNSGASFRLTFPDAVPEAESAMERLKSIRGRLGVRLRADHAVVIAFGNAHDAARNATNAMATQDPSGSAHLTAHPTVPDEHRRLIDATDEFMRAAIATVGARLPYGHGAP